MKPIEWMTARKLFKDNGKKPFSFIPDLFTQDVRPRHWTILCTPWLGDSIIVPSFEIETKISPTNSFIMGSLQIKVKHNIYA